MAAGMGGVMIYGVRRVEREPVGMWAEDAACRGSASGRGVFFADRRTPRGQADTAVAKEICAGCRVRRECLELAVKNGERHGVWGGYAFPMAAITRRRLGVD